MRDLQGVGIDDDRRRQGQDAAGRGDADPGIPRHGDRQARPASGSRTISAGSTVFAGVRDLPTRVKCAILPWHTLHAALNSVASTSTEAEDDPMHAPIGDA